MGTSKIATLSKYTTTKGRLGRRKGANQCSVNAILGNGFTEGARLVQKLSFVAISIYIVACNSSKLSQLLDGCISRPIDGVWLEVPRQ